MSLRSSNPPSKGSGKPRRPDLLERKDALTNTEPPEPGNVDLPSGVNVQALAAIIPDGPSFRRNSNISFAGDRRSWVQALARGEEGAAVAFFHEYESLVERTIARIMGADSDLADATQDAFIRALRSIHRLRDPQAMTEWVLKIAVCTAADWLRRRQRRHWLMFRDPTELLSLPAATVDAADREALRATYSILDKLKIEERSVFALRMIDGMELKEVAVACDCSVATVKRRMARAEARFVKLARLHPCLLPWIASTECKAGP